MTRSTFPNSDNDNTLDEVFNILSHHTRRRILHLIALENPRSLHEIEPVTTASSGEEVNQQMIQLFHNHLPALVDAGFITWERDSDRIARGPRFEHIQPLLTLFQNHRDELPHDWP